MTIERFTLVTITVFSIISVFYIPKDKYRLAIISFNSFQFLSWFGSIIIVNHGNFEYPVREFVRATRVVFIPYFVFLPVIFTWFILLFPHNAKLPKKIAHYFFFVSASICFLYFINMYTEIEHIKKGALFSNYLNRYIRVFIYFIVCHIYISWFSKKTNLSQGAS